MPANGEDDHVTSCVCRSECIDVAERLLLIYPASAPAIEAARKSEENVVAAMEHGHMHDLGRNVDLESYVADDSIVTSS
jgi:predicted methyltransferase MtxX (methanogen marker protein 4)